MTQITPIPLPDLNDNFARDWMEPKKVYYTMGNSTGVLISQIWSRLAESSAQASRSKVNTPTPTNH